MKTLLVSTWDKTGLVELIEAFAKTDTLRVIATSSTAQHLQKAGISCESVEHVTGFPEFLEGRVKTLHPAIFGGILAKPTSAHMQQLREFMIPAIDVVIVNLYPFESTIEQPDVTDADAIEHIDVGGVSLLRAAAKNFERVTVIPSIELYQQVQDSLTDNNGFVPPELRQRLALEAFVQTSHYDQTIANWYHQKIFDGPLPGASQPQPANAVASRMAQPKPTPQPTTTAFTKVNASTASASKMPDTVALNLHKISNLRYGENPHQDAAWYRQTHLGREWPFKQYQGKELSANNIVDTYSAYQIIREFPGDPCVCIIKHNNPCGVALGNTIEEAYRKALAADPVSAFGGIFSFNRTLTEPIAQSIYEQFVEIVIAPSYTDEALAILQKKKNLRILEMPELRNDISAAEQWSLKDLGEFGFLIQTSAFSEPTPRFSPVTSVPLHETTLADMRFAWCIVKHLTSNAIVVVKNGQTLGLGIGQTSRIASTKLALAQAGSQAHGAVLASDGFFPAVDNIEEASDAGISVIVQPGGSVKDSDVITKAKELGLAMCLTGERCFKH